MEDALTLDELRVLAAVLQALEQLDASGARANDFAVGLVGRLRMLPDNEAVAPYREQARPSVELSLELWADQRRWAGASIGDRSSLVALIKTVERDDARAIIFAIAYEAATHCAIMPGEAEFLAVLEREWQLSIE